MEIKVAKSVEKSEKAEDIMKVDKQRKQQVAVIEMLQIGNKASKMNAIAACDEMTKDELKKFNDMLLTALSYTRNSYRRKLTGSKDERFAEFQEAMNA